MFALNSKKNTHQRWLEAAYEQFAEVGPDHLNVKALSRTTGLPRTNFYYYFHDKEDLIEQLLKAHIDLSSVYESELNKKLKVLIPDLYDILTEFKTGIKFHWQLFQHRQDIRFAHIYNTLNRSSNKFIVPRVKEYYRLDIPEPSVEAIWNTLIDTWYARLDFENYNSITLSGLTEDIMQTLLEFTGQITRREIAKQ